MANQDRVGASVSFKAQIMQYEPIEVSAWAEFEVNRNPDETPEQARSRTWQTCWDEIQKQATEQLKVVASLFRQVRSKL